MADMTDVQTTYEKLKEIADNDPLTFREEWNKGLGYGALLSIKKMEEFDDTMNAFGLSPIQVFRLDCDYFLDTDFYFVFDGYNIASSDKIGELLSWLDYNYDRALYRWVYNVAFPEFSITNDEKSFYNQFKVKGE